MIGLLRFQKNKQDLKGKEMKNHLSKFAESQLKKYGWKEGKIVGILNSIQN